MPTGHALLAADPILLTLIVGQRSFSENPDSTDACNGYFTVVGWLLVALLVLAVFALFAFVYFLGKGVCKYAKSQASDRL